MQSQMNDVLPQRKPWRKILYERQDYPDNYVDKSFLKQMRRNVNTKVYSMSTLMYESGIFSQQLSSVCIFVSVFTYMDSNMVSASTVLLVLIALATIGYILSLLLEMADDFKALVHTGQDLKSAILFTTFVLGLSPLLKTLTKTISTDTIYAMTKGRYPVIYLIYLTLCPTARVFMLATNLLLHDYSTEISTASRSPSLNASIFASVCLASRLTTAWHAFATVMLAMQIFAVMPQIRMKLKSRRRTAFTSLTLLMSASSIVMIAFVSVGLAFALLVAHFAISVLIPWWMVRLQRHKNNIHGPWDEAMIRD